MRFFLFAIAGLFAGPALALRVVDSQVILDELTDYELCQKKDYSGDWCHDAMKRWVKAHPADAFQAGKLTRRKMNAWTAVPFFAEAFAAGKGDCKDEDVKLALLSALELPPANGDDALTQAKELAHGKCFPELKSGILNAASLSSNTFKNSCSVLKAKGLISGLKAKKCG